MYYLDKDKMKEKQKKNERAIRKRCPKCNHHKMFKNRGERNSNYKYKCTKCGHITK